MRIAVMQPYLFPYIGYFQLIYTVNTFVLYDDVQYINKGWINRNNFLLNQNPYLFTFSVKKDSRFKNINERFFSDSHEHDKKTFLKFLTTNYNDAPFFTTVYELIETILSFNQINLASKIGFSIQQICNYLQINTPLIFSSSLTSFSKNDFQGQDRIIALCKILESDHYINPIGGQQLYSHSLFNSNNIKLSFLKTSQLNYNQFGNSFVPNLSIIDVLMFNSIEDIHKLLKMFDLIDAI